jgi:hypothetical protein
MHKSCNTLREKRGWGGLEVAIFRQWVPRVPVCPPSFLPAAHDLFFPLPTFLPAARPPAHLLPFFPPSFVRLSVSRRCRCCCAARLLQQCPRSVCTSEEEAEHHRRRRRRHAMVDDALDLIPKPKSPISLTAWRPCSLQSVLFLGCLSGSTSSGYGLLLYSFSCLSTICLSTVEDSPPRSLCGSNKPSSIIRSQ